MPCKRQKAFFATWFAKRNFSLIVLVLMLVVFFIPTIMLSVVPVESRTLPSLITPQDKAAQEKKPEEGGQPTEESPSADASAGEEKKDTEEGEYKEK